MAAGITKLEEINVTNYELELTLPVGLTNLKEITVQYRSGVRQHRFIFVANGATATVWDRDSYLRGALNKELEERGIADIPWLVRRLLRAVRRLTTAHVAILKPVPVPIERKLVRH